MKILFIITVIIAAIYLFIQQKGLEKISQYLPSQQIEQNAQTLLSTINQQVTNKVNKELTAQLEQFKKELLTQKDARIEALAKKVVDLESKLDEQQKQYVATQALSDSSTLTTEFPREPEFAKVQYLTNKQSIESGTAIVAGAHSAKQTAIKRQANLQDIADRMNKTSLLALTK